MVTATRVMPSKPRGLRATTRSSKGNSASAWPPCMGTVSDQTGSVSPGARRQADVAASAVSIARITPNTSPKPFVRHECAGRTSSQRHANRDSRVDWPYQICSTA